MYSKMLLDWVGGFISHPHVTNYNVMLTEHFFGK